MRISSRRAGGRGCAHCSDYLLLYNKQAQIEWLKVTAIVYFSHGPAIQAELSRNSFSLLHSAGVANKG